MCVSFDAIWYRHGKKANRAVDERRRYELHIIIIIIIVIIIHCLYYLHHLYHLCQPPHHQCTTLYVASS